MHNFRTTELSDSEYYNKFKVTESFPHKILLLIFGNTTDVSYKPINPAVTSVGKILHGRTPDVLWLRKAERVDVSKHEPQEDVCYGHDGQDAHAHVQSVHAEVHSLKQLKAVSTFSHSPVILNRGNYLKFQVSLRLPTKLNACFFKARRRRIMMKCHRIKSK